ncbi:MAG: class I SAM-dependent methyltransferase [Veillonella sp.]
MNCGSDETMSYSCAYFKHENDSLKDAQYQRFTIFSINCT